MGPSWSLLLGFGHILGFSNGSCFGSFAAAAIVT